MNQKTIVIKTEPEADIDLTKLLDDPVDYGDPVYCKVCKTKLNYINKRDSEYCEVHRPPGRPKESKWLFKLNGKVKED